MKFDFIQREWYIIWLFPRDNIQMVMRLQNDSVQDLVTDVTSGNFINIQ